MTDAAGAEASAFPADLFERLLTHPLFVGASPAELSAALLHCQLSWPEPGSFLLQAGESNDRLFLVLNGALSARIVGSDVNVGFRIGPGECVGEVSIIDGRPVTAAVVVEEPSTLLVVPERLLWDDVFAQQRLLRNFLSMFTDRFRQRNEDMRTALEERLRYEQLQRELDLAVRIQTGMLPPEVDTLPGYRATASMVPAREVGGDLYDLFPLPDDRYAFAIGDVAGKGVPAALFMVRVMTLMRAELPRADTLADAALQLNRQLCAVNDAAMFVTLVLGVVHEDRGHIDYVSAGHNPICLCPAHGGCEVLEPPEGIPLGILDTMPFTAGRIELGPGDALVLYTDGVTEAMDAERNQFGMERFVETLSACPRPLQAQAVQQAVTAAVAEFVAGEPASDDLTLMVLVRR